MGTRSMEGLNGVDVGLGQVDLVEILGEKHLSKSTPQFLWL